MTPESIERFSELFTSYSGAYGQFTVTHYNEDKSKWEGQARTSYGESTFANWQIHLNGNVGTPTNLKMVGASVGMGAIPLLEDDTVLWGALDIDVYDKELTGKLSKRVSELDLPLVACTTKSTGCHLYLFLSERAPASKVRSWLEQVAAVLGYGGCEVFPKQHTRTGPRDVGNWINLPYQGGDKSMRRALVNDRLLTVDEFIQYATSKKLNIKELTKKKVEVEEFNDGPPCLQHLYSIGGFPEHTRNDGMFNVGIYLKRKYPDKWQDMLPAYNDTMCKGSQTLSDINGICKTLGAKDYTYKCKASPIKPHCVRRTCLRRQFGVGTGPKTMGIEITSITKYPASPTIWCVEIDGARFEVDTDTLFYQSAFAKKCMDVISRCPAPLPAEEWQKYLDEKIKDADEVPPPEDADEVGQFKLFLDIWLNGRTTAKSRDEIILDKPFRDMGRVYFLSSALRKRLDQERFRYKSMHHVWNLLRDLGADKETWNLRGNKTRQIWSLPDFAQEQQADIETQPPEPF